MSSDPNNTAGILSKLEKIATTAHPERIDHPIPLAAAEASHCIRTLEERMERYRDALSALYAATPDNEGGALGAACVKARAALNPLPQPASARGEE